MKIIHKSANSSISREEIEYAFKFFIKKLLNPYKKRPRITVHINSAKDIGNDKAYCIQEGGSKPKTFWIVLSEKLGKNAALKALAHETIHIKQGYLSEAWEHEAPNLGWVRWKKWDILASQIKYRELPWEIEAFNKEKNLYKSYMRHKKKYGLTF